MNPTVVIWILAAVVAVLVGREVGKRLFDVNTKLMAKKRAAQVLAAKLRANGLKLLPALLEDFAVGDVQDMVEKIHDVAKLVESGSDAIEKELDEPIQVVDPTSTQPVQDPSPYFRDTRLFLEALLFCRIY